MAKLKVEPKKLIALGFPKTAAISVTMSIMEKHYKHATWEEVEPLLQNILDTPEQFWEDEILGKIAEKIKEPPSNKPEKPKLLAQALPFHTFGAEGIEDGAVRQMRSAMRLPISRAGALMPDAHQGYGLPIGGVLATEGAVIPYGVGVDIGCRMCLSVLPIAANEFQKRAKMLETSLMENTVFGAGGEWKTIGEHEVLDRSLFQEIPLLKNMQLRAARQLGTSGSGNHFVEFGIVDFPHGDAHLSLAAGQYIGLLSHSGSRGLGANIANHFTKIAMEKRKIDGEARYLAWLFLTEEAGAEYWAAMNLAGDYASACHHTIHERIAKSLGIKPLAMVENHHNFAWKELHEGKEWIVHRKGATPAGEGVFGIIPGSMTAAGYIVRGRGEAAGLHSASHGAGRKMSRSKAKESITHSALNKYLKQHEVTLIGGGLDEAPHAYKDITEVMRSQQTLVDIVGTFAPKIVRMDDH